MDGIFCVYILENNQRKKYIGITSNLPKRLEEHNTGKSKFTASRGPWNLIWNSFGMDHTSALKLEILMKRQKGGSGLKALQATYAGS